MRARTVAVAIALFAGIDLIILAALPLFGVPGLPAATPGSLEHMALTGALILAALALIGTVSILLTGKLEPRLDLLGYEVGCYECGALPHLELAFCGTCGADA